MPVADVYKQKLSIGTKSLRSIWFTSLCTRESSQNGNSTGTWQSRSRIGVYVVHSTLHSGIRVLVLNPKREFITVNQNLDKTKISMDKQLQHLFTSEQRNFSDDHEENVTQRHHIDSTWWPVMTQIRSWREEILKHETSVKVQQTRMHKKSNVRLESTICQLISESPIQRESTTTVMVFRGRCLDATIATRRHSHCW